MSGMFLHYSVDSIPNMGGWDMTEGKKLAAFRISAVKR